MSRTRLLRPEFFADAVMGRLPVACRLTYMGLWTLADDAGYFELAPTEIRVALWPHEARGRGLKIVEEALERLVDERRVVVLDCHEHAVIPTLPDHRIKGGEQLFTIKKRHDRRCTPPDSVGLHSPGLRRTPSGYIPDSVSDSVTGPDSVSVSRSAQARTTTELDDAAVAAGGFVARLAARRTHGNLALVVAPEADS